MGNNIPKYNEPQKILTYASQILLKIKIIKRKIYLAYIKKNDEYIISKMLMETFINADVSQEAIINNTTDMDFLVVNGEIPISNFKLEPIKEPLKLNPIDLSRILKKQKIHTYKDTIRYYLHVEPIYRALMKTLNDIDIYSMQLNDIINNLHNSINQSVINKCNNINYINECNRINNILNIYTVNYL